MHLLCSPANIFWQNQNNEVQHHVFLMLLLYISLIFGESVDNEDVSVDSFCLHHIRQLLYYPSAGLLLSGSPERARKRRLSAYSCTIFMVISAKETPLISTCSPSPCEAATTSCSGTNQSQWHTTATRVARVPDCAPRCDTNYHTLCRGDKNHH